MISYSSFRQVLKTILRGTYLDLAPLEIEIPRSAGMVSSMFTEILWLKSGNYIPSIHGLTDSKAQVPFPSSLGSLNLASRDEQKLGKKSDMEGAGVRNSE